MRTTLDIDDDVLQAAKELAKAEGKTAGRVLSDFARSAMTSSPGGFEERPAMILKNGFFVLASRGGAIVTKELVDRLIDEADLEDAGLKTK
jgi:Bacterial antitoxin of type II TA system, VapB